MTVLFEGQSVLWAGGGGFRARGSIVAIAGPDSAHVKWATGPDAGDVVLADVYDLEPITSAYDVGEDPLHLTSVRKTFDNAGEVGVLNFLASNNYLDTWRKIAVDVIEYVEDRIKRDASMELVEEQLTPAEQHKVVQTAALALLRDAFSEIAE